VVRGGSRRGVVARRGVVPRACAHGLKPARARPAGMSTVVLSRGERDLAVVGALSSMDEAVAMDQMRFVLAWAIRVQSVARCEPAPQGPLPVSALSPASDPEAPGLGDMDGAPSGW
jgi:hypothetical protein